MKFIKVHERSPSTGSPSGKVFWVRSDYIVSISNSNRISLANGEIFYFTDDLKETLTSLKISFETTKGPKISSAKKKTEERDRIVLQVLDHYRKSYPRRAKTVKRGSDNWKLISKRIEEGFSVEELKKAIDGNKLCPWHKARPAGHSIEYIFRKQTKVWQFIALAEGDCSPNPDEDNTIGHHKGSEEFTDGSRGDSF